MLVPVTFAYRVDCIPSKGRNARRMLFLDRMIVQIDEHTKSEAPVAYSATTCAPAKEDQGANNDIDEIVTIDGRLFRALRTENGREEVDLQHFLRELASDAGNQTLAFDDPERVLPDVLGLRKIAGLPQWRTVREFVNECKWPSKRIEEVPLRRIVENFHEQDIISVARAATRLVIVDGRLFIESGEPIWRLRLIGYPDGRTNSMHLGVVTHRHIQEELEAKQAGLVPFADYRLHRIDRTTDLVDEIRQLDDFCSPNGVSEAIAIAKSAPVDILSAADPALDLTTPMLMDLAMRTHATAVRLSADQKEDSLFVTLAQAIAGYEPPRKGAHAVEIAACLRDLHTRLTDRTVKQAPDGSLNRHLNAIPPALRRLEHDLAQGLVETPVLEGADDEALDALT